MRTVYIVQETEGRNYSDAMRHGDDMKVILSQWEVSVDVAELRKTIEERMTYFKKNDLLLLTGSPLALVIAGNVAEKKTGGEFTFLQWDRQNRLYVPLKNK